MFRNVAPAVFPKTAAATFFPAAAVFYPATFSCSCNFFPVALVLDARARGVKLSQQSTSTADFFKTPRTYYKMVPPFVRGML